MLRAQQPSSPLAFYASTASAFPATGTSSSYTTDNNNAGDREACPSSPIASTSHTGSPLHVSSSRPKAASVLRRYQYKSRSPAAGSSSTTTVPSSSPLGRWHDQLLYNSAQRARQDRERSRSGTRGGLLLLEREHGPEGRDLSESEQMVVRRLWRREQERRQEQLELDWEDQQLGVINEQDLEELELDALRAAATAEDTAQAIPEEIEEELGESFDWPSSRPEDNSSSGMDLDAAATPATTPQMPSPPTSPLSVRDALLSGPCLSCHTSTLSAQASYIGCHGCGWSVSPQALQSAQEEVDQHLVEKRSTSALIHHLSLVSSPAVGIVATCSCGDMFMLD